MMTRRKWLLRAAVLGSAAWLPRSAPLAAATGPTDRTHPVRRLVLVELAGANDGLNTLVPWRDERYHALRPTLGLREADVLDLGAGELGLHAALRPLMPMLEAGELAIVQGLGYPRPNRSHFASIDYWHTGGDGEIGSGPAGWLTHAIEHGLGRPVDDVHGISLDGPIGPLASASGRWLSAESLAALARLDVPVEAAPAASARDPIARMRARVQALDTTLDRLQRRLVTAPALPAFRGGDVGEQLREVARFMLAGLDTPVYRVRLGGFDTHVNQRGRHQRLLTQLGAGLADFRRHLSRTSLWQDTLVLSYSEFGRRAAENRSGGTDHGTAAPHLMIGGALRRTGLLGRAPDLSQLEQGDPAATMDYRSLYGATLSQWFGIEQHRFTDHVDAGLDRLFA